MVSSVWESRTVFKAMALSMTINYLRVYILYSLYPESLQNSKITLKNTSLLSLPECFKDKMKE